MHNDAHSLLARQALRMPDVYCCIMQANTNAV